MKSRIILFLVVLAIIFSIISIVSDSGIMQVTGGTARNIDLPGMFSFVVVILLILVILIVIIDLTLLRKQL